MSRQHRGERLSGLGIPEGSDSGPHPRQQRRRLPDGPGTEIEDFELMPPQFVLLSEKQRRQAVSALAVLLLPLLHELEQQERAA